MATYFFQATDPAGEIIEGDIEASNYQVAVQKVRNLNYFPIQVTQEQPRRSLFKAWTALASLDFSFSKMPIFIVLPGIQILTKTLFATEPFWLIEGVVAWVFLSVLYIDDNTYDWPSNV